MIKFRLMDLRAPSSDWAWMKQRVSPILCEDTEGVVAYESKTGVILGCCVADSFGPDSCYVHICIENPLIIRRGFLNIVAHALFDLRGLDRLFGLVPGNNERAYKFDRHIGFTEVARVPDGFTTGVDYIVMRMDKANCRWLQEEVREAA